MPEKRAFNDFFDSYEVWTQKHSGPNNDIVTPSKHRISHYFSIENQSGSYHPLAVTPNKALIDLICANMLAIEYDSLYFKAVFQTDGTALLIVQHNQIIGSRWLSYIDGKTVPTDAEVTSV
jgi:hypothetical protein